VVVLVVVYPAVHLAHHPDVPLDGLILPHPVQLRHGMDTRFDLRVDQHSHKEFHGTVHAFPIHFLVIRHLPGFHRISHQLEVPLHGLILPEHVPGVVGVQASLCLFILEKAEEEAHRRQVLVGSLIVHLLVMHMFMLMGLGIMLMLVRLCPDGRHLRKEIYRSSALDVDAVRQSHLNPGLVCDGVEIRIARFLVHLLLRGILV
jgi:hypothetical protein